MALDGLGGKLLSIFRSKEDSRFKGQGRKLGSAEAPSNCDGQGEHRSSDLVKSGNGVLAQAPGPAPSASPRDQLQPPPQPLGHGGRPSLLVSRSHRTEDVVLDAAVMVTNTPTGREATLMAANKLPCGPGSPTSPAASHGTASPLQPASPYSPTSSLLQNGTAPAANRAPAVAPRVGAGGSGDAPRVGGGGARNTGLQVEVPRMSGGRSSGGGGGGGGGQQQERSTGGRQSRMLSNVSSMVSTISTPTAAEKRIGGGFRCRAPPTDGAMADYGVAPASSEAYELQRCLALVLSNVPPAPKASCPAPAPPSTQPASAPLASRAGPPPPSLASDSSAHTHASTSRSASASTSDMSLSLGGAGAGGGEQAPGLAEAASQPPATSAQASDLERGTGTPLGAGTASEAAAAGAAGGAELRVAGPRECCDALLRVLRNVLTKPGEAKYRQIRLSNPKVQETIVRVPGATEFLEAAGFRLEFKDADGSEDAVEGYLVLPDEVQPTALAEPFRLLSAAMAAHGFTSSGGASEPSTATAAAVATAAASLAPAARRASEAGSGAAAAGAQSTAAAPTPAPAAVQVSPLAARAAAMAAAAANAPSVERCTQVVLPTAPDAEVPEWFFERTGAEIRAQWQSMLRQRQEAEQFMTRTMREVHRQQQKKAAEAEEAKAASAAGGAGHPDVAVVRVRFPEGVCLQGHFGASEPVSRVFEWVSASLRSPALTFELVKPDRQPLQISAPLTTTAAASSSAAAAAASRARPQAGGPSSSASAPLGPLTIRSADLLPAVLLNLRPTGHEAAQLAAARVPLLSDQVLQATTPQ